MYTVLPFRKKEKNAYIYVPVFAPGISGKMRDKPLTMESLGGDWMARQEEDLLLTVHPFAFLSFSFLFFGQ